MRRREFLGILGISPMIALLRKIPNVDPEGEKIFEILEGSDDKIRYYGGVDFGFPSKLMKPGDVVMLDESGRLVKYPGIEEEDPHWRRVIGIVNNVNKDFVDISLKMEEI